MAVIGAPPELVRRTPADGFPALITRHGAGDVDDCGWASRRSFGASSWLVVRPGGHALWAEHFTCPRWIHAADADAAPGAEQRVEGREPVVLDGDLTLIPTPGHTAGSMVAVLRQRAQVLFSGDHLWWQPALGEVVASCRYWWWNWEELVRSVERMLDLDVALLLPGQGERHAFAPWEWLAAITRTMSLAKGG